MNRELKFRAWDISERRMYNDIDFQSNKEYFSSVIMQFTGLHDKNGVEIYEGDIVKHITSIGFEFEGEVIYKEYGFGIEGKLDFMPLTKKASYDDGRSSFSYTIEYEILGNKYENRESLKQKDGN